jgi:hypothetical protein
MIYPSQISAFAGLFFAIAVSASAQDPRTNCWFTKYSGQYARVYTNAIMQISGTTLTTWGNGTQNQTQPAYCGVQEVYSSTNWVYVRTTGLASYYMGPWYQTAAHTSMFVNLPINQQLLYRFPCTNAVPTTKDITEGGQIGVFVDGVTMFNSWDGNTWVVASNADEMNGNGYWNRDAYVNEGATFDPAYAHQQQGGVYHYHADPIGLRYLLGDHVDFNSSTKIFSEDTNTPTQHSPILAWVGDGFPLYGPYGYSNPTNPASGIRRMVSGYVLRNGQDGTMNLSSTERTALPQWAVRLYEVSSNQPGPNVSVNYPLDRYMEDNDYLGDLINTNTGTNFQQGVDFDLDQYNGRFCYTPDFPTGTYAYFVAIDSNGVPVFPYNIGRGYYGEAVGGSVAVITEPVVTNYLGYTNLVSTLNSPSVGSGNVTLTWSALEGGGYTVQMTTNAADPTWSSVATGVSPNEISGGNTNNATYNQQFYRVSRTSLAAYEGAGTTLFGLTNCVASGGAAYPGQNVMMTITLPTSPPNPPINLMVSTVFLTNTSTAFNITGLSVTRPTTNTVTAIFPIPNNASAQALNVQVDFSPMPTYTLSGGFTIN